jgi:tRNA G18 (ribose-2'-O)-methylase SpoU
MENIIQKKNGKWNLKNTNNIAQKTTELPETNKPRNVIDRFSAWTTELIKDELNKTSFNYSVLFENIIGDFNFGTLIRNSNAFNTKSVYYIGNRKFDRRSTVGTYLYQTLIHLPERDALLELKKKYTFVGIDCVPGSVSMESFSWPENTLMIFGEEGRGVTPETLLLCDHVVHITQYGSVRSLNVGTASGIAMYDWIGKTQKA